MVKVEMGQSFLVSRSVLNECRSPASVVVSQSCGVLTMSALSIA
jgi:hypothetical protein